MKATNFRIGNWVNIDNPSETQKSPLRIESGKQIDSLESILHSPIP